MKKEKGVITVVYKEPRDTPRYLVLKRNKNWEGWETPKGQLEQNDHRKTVRIELEEEAGLENEDIQEIQDMEKTVSWEYEREGEKRKKEYRAFLVKVSDNAKIDVSANPHDEHEKGFFFNYRDARQLITHENNRELLETANQRLEK